MEKGDFLSITINKEKGPLQVYCCSICGQDLYCLWGKEAGVMGL